MLDQDKCLQNLRQTGIDLAQILNLQQQHEGDEAVEEQGDLQGIPDVFGTDIYTIGSGISGNYSGKELMEEIYITKTNLDCSKGFASHWSKNEALLILPPPPFRRIYIKLSSILSTAQLFFSHASVISPCFLLFNFLFSLYTYYVCIFTYHYKTKNEYVYMCGM